MKRGGENASPSREASIYSGEDTGTVKKTSISRSWRYRSKGKAVSPRKGRGSLLRKERSERREEVEDATRNRGRSIKDMIRFYDGGKYCVSPVI